MIRDVLVHLDGSPDDESRLLYAEAIASMSQAHITGLFTNPLPDLSAMGSFEGGVVAADIVAQLDMDARSQGNDIERRLIERLSRLEVPNEIRRLEEPAERLPWLVANEARSADLFIAGMPYRENGAARWDRLFETVLFESGRGVLAVPPGRELREEIRRVLVCWRNTRESVRATTEAVPILTLAARTVILLVDPTSERLGQVEQEPAADIARHLVRCGAKVEINIVDSNRREISEVLLEHAHRLSADLVVMGAYGHSRTREWLIGGATRDMLSVSDCPILLAH